MIVTDIVDEKRVKLERDGMPHLQLPEGTERTHQQMLCSRPD